MGKHNLSFFLVLFVSFVAVNSEYVPVFIWGKPSVTYLPALTGYTSNEFAALVESQINEKTFTAVFIENGLSTENLSQCKLKTQTCFQNLQKFSRKSYLPNVENPYSILGASNNAQLVQVSAEGDLSEPVVAEPGKIVVFTFDDDDFSSHDQIISELYKQFSAENADVLAIYTGKTPSFKYVSETPSIRKTRQAPAPTPKNDGTLLQVKDRFMMNYVEFKFDGTPTALTTATAVNTTDSGFGIELSGADGRKLEMTFIVTQGNWELSKLAFDNTEMYLRNPISINQHFSFHCSNLTFHTMDMLKEMTFTEVQFQPHWSETGEEPFEKFGDSWDCVGFTSPGILSGLFIVLIFILIVSIGITWMMDIKTMDRFDDPKGKTITINAAD